VQQPSNFLPTLDYMYSLSSIRTNEDATPPAVNTVTAANGEVNDKPSPPNGDQ
jgi:hypothetical protein